MKVLLKNVLIQEISEDEKKSNGGIILSTTPNYSTPVKNKVVAVGSEVKDVKVGDIAYYSPRAGWEIKENDSNYRIIAESDIIAIL